MKLLNVTELYTPKLVTIKYTLFEFHLKKLIERRQIIQFAKLANDLDKCLNKEAQCVAKKKKHVKNA